MYKSYDYQGFYSPGFTFDKNSRFSQRGPATHELAVPNPPNGLDSSQVRIIPVEYETLKRKVDEVKQAPQMVFTGEAPTPNIIERFGSQVIRVVTAEMLILVALFAIDVAFGGKIRALPFCIKCALIGIVSAALLYFATRNEHRVPIF